MAKFTIKKQFLLFFIGFVLYMLIEILFRGYTYYTMGFAGGLAFILIGLINEILSWDLFVEIQMIISSIIVTLIELISGTILLDVFGMRMWDYSDQLFNYRGFICPLFSIAWLFLGLAAILLDDYIRYVKFNEEKPRYTSFILRTIKNIKNKLMG